MRGYFTEFFCLAEGESNLSTSFSGGKTQQNAERRKNMER